VLLGRRTRDPGRRYPGVWDAHGGKPEPGESLLAALAREAREEAGIEPLDLTALGCFDDGDRADAFYVASAWKGEPSNHEPTEHSELAWVPLRRAAELPMAPTTREALARLAAVVGSRSWLHPRRRYAITAPLTGYRLAEGGKASHPTTETRSRGGQP
jgi:8-oxo-dGTP diphosphatase